jgi:hypothetical protein
VIKYESSSGREAWELLAKEGGTTFVVSTSSMMAMGGGMWNVLPTAEPIVFCTGPGQLIVAFQARIQVEFRIRIMSRDDTLFPAIQGPLNATSLGQNKVDDGVIHAGDTVLLRLPTGDIKSCKLEAESCVTPNRSSNDLTPKQNGKSGEIWLFYGGRTCKPAVWADIRDC